MVMSTLKENLEYLERSTEKWTNFNFKLEGFISQTDGIIDKLKSILSEEASPEERLRKLDVRIKFLADCLIIYIYIKLFTFNESGGKMLKTEIRNNQKTEIIICFQSLYIIKVYCIYYAIFWF